MSDQLNYKEDIDKKYEEQFRKFYNFYKNNYRLIMIAMVLVLLLAVGKRYYREYQTRKKVEQLVEEKLEEIRKEENNNSLQDSSDDNIPDFTQIINNLSMDEIIEYMNENEDIKSLFSEKEYEELMKMLNGLDGLYDIFSSEN